MRLRPYGKHVLATIVWNRDKPTQSGLLLAEEGMPKLREAQVVSVGEKVSDQSIQPGIHILFRNFLALEDISPKQILIPEVFIEAVLDPS